MPATRIVYLLHFKRPLRHAQHYLGSTTNLEMRVNAHNHGGGSRITQAAHDLGIEFELVRVWPTGGRRLERTLKNQHNGKRLCPKCRDEHLARRREERATKGVRCRTKQSGPSQTVSGSTRSKRPTKS